MAALIILFPCKTRVADMYAIISSVGYTPRFAWMKRRRTAIIVADPPEPVVEIALDGPAIKRLNEFSKWIKGRGPKGAA